MSTDPLYDEFDLLKQQLTDYYRAAFTESPHYCTLPITQQEVELVKRLISLVGGQEAIQVMRLCWNRASKDFPHVQLATRQDFPFYREGWNKRGV
jgi:hypothetical protein